MKLANVFFLGKLRDKAGQEHAALCFVRVQSSMFFLFSPQCGICSRCYYWPSGELCVNDGNGPPVGGYAHASRSRSRSRSPTRGCTAFAFAFAFAYAFASASNRTGQVILVFDFEANVPSVKDSVMRSA